MDIKDTTLCYIEKDGRYLMLHRVKKEKDLNAGKWIGVGGHVEAGETPEGCIRREIAEETGLTAGKLIYRGVVDFISDRDECERMFLYTCNDFRGSLKTCDEGILEWVEKSKISTLNLWDGDLIFLNALAEDKPFFHLKLSYHNDTLVDHFFYRRIILASNSPRRRELLTQINIYPEILPSTKEEVVTSSDPSEVVSSLSRQKAENVNELISDRDDCSLALIIGADTVVYANDKILGKPKTHEEAFDMIKSLSGKTHHVYTGVTIIDKEKNKTQTFAEKTDVTVYEMTDDEIKKYADSEEPMDKAGAYGIQGTFAKYIKCISGDYNNVVGLPVSALYQRIKKLY